VKQPILFLALVLVPALVTAQSSSPQQIADELLAADRAFAAASAKTDLITGLSTQFAGDVAMPTPAGFVFGSQKAIDALKANPANTGAKAEWIPARVAVSSDGKHGFTAGFMTITRADGSVNPAKYLAYWERQAGGWRALVYKRTPAKSAAPATPVSYVLPKQIVPAKNDAAALEKNRESLADAERSFSRDAQTMGIGPAFKKYGSPDAINLAGPETLTFVMGNDAIGDNVGSGAPPNTSPVTWGPEKTIIAASGDFGVTIGYIVRNQPAADGKTVPGQPFFTIWRKDADGVWRYIAE
jgi:ketosteroid isomerase-like protein